MLRTKPLRHVAVAGIVCLLTAHCARAESGVGSGLSPPVGVATDPQSASGPLLDGLSLESQAARFARDDPAPTLYAVTRPQWNDEQPEWLDPQHMVSATAFEDIPHEALAGPPPQPSSLWERWRQQRQARRRRPATWFRYRLYFEKFTSLIRTDEPIHDQIHNGRGNLFGVRLGWDFAPRWGIETRLGYLRSAMTDTAHPLLPPHENFFFWDTSALFYLTGDVRWRPFILTGLGAVNVGFIDDQGVRWNQTLLTMPFGAGFKFRINDHNALRFEVLDNLLFGNGHGGNSRAMDDLAVSFAFERRFGRPHKSYFPNADAGRWTRCREWFESMSH